MVKDNNMAKQKELVEDVSDQLNKVIVVETKRKNGTIRLQQDFRYCPTMAEQHTAHLSDINYLMKTFQPDELAAYIAARKSHRQEVIGHDFSVEPNLQEGKNAVYRLQTAFQNLPENIRNQFKNHVEFLKFIDNPANQQKMLDMGLLTKKQIADNTTTPTTTTQEAKEKKDVESDLAKNSSGNLLPSKASEARRDRAMLTRESRRSDGYSKI